MCTGAELAAAMAAAGGTGAAAAGVGDAALTGLAAAAPVAAAGAPTAAGMGVGLGGALADAAGAGAGAAATGMGGGTAALFGPTAAQTGLLATGGPAGLGSFAAAPEMGIPALAQTTPGAASMGAQMQGMLTNALGGGTTGMDRVAALGQGMDALGKVQKVVQPIQAAQGLLARPAPAGGGGAARPPMGQVEPMPNIAQRMGQGGMAQGLPPELIAQLRAKGIDPMQFMMMMRQRGG